MVVPNTRSSLLEAGRPLNPWKSDDSLSVVVAIPCYNEAAAIGAVIDEWRTATPDASIVVFNNNSNDESGRIATDHGARVIEVPDQGKGFVVRQIFEVFSDSDAVILIDGDGTYPAEVVGPLLSAVLEGRAAMSVGTRRPIESSGAMTPVRGFGNWVIGIAFRTLIGPGTTDLLSGYRVFSREFMKTVQLRSSGFEIETELAGEAEGRGLPVLEFPVPYRPRIAGTSSKLRAVQDGFRILAMILRLSFRLRPWRLFGLIAAPLTILLTIFLASWIWGLGLALGFIGLLAFLLVLRKRAGLLEARTDG